MKPVTIVVPVYKDWKTLERCIASLERHVQPPHRILLINDQSNEAIDLEKKTLAAIDGKPGFMYERNPCNMGFVKTCNRAVYHLDTTSNDILLLNSDTEVTEGFLEEMSEVLNISEKHAVVCPRSNNATILSIPYQLEEPRELHGDRSLLYHQRVAEHLPRYFIIPTGVGFCMLIRRSIIDNFGLFDEVYGLGYNEENDFCSRINRYGYSAVMANRAFVFHAGTCSFTPEQKTLQDKTNEHILSGRYPEYFPAVGRYCEYRIDPADYFSEIICGVYPKKRLLFGLYLLADQYNGTAEYGLSLLDQFTRMYGDKYDISVLTNREGAAFHKLEDRFERIIYLDELGTSGKKFDITFVPSQIFSLEFLALLNRHSLKIIFVLQDIIAWRCNYLTSPEAEFCLQYSFLFCDGIVAISDFSRKDALDYIGMYDLVLEEVPPVRVIHHSYLKRESEEEYACDVQAPDVVSGIPAKGFILLLGNHYSHKALALALKSLQTLDCNIVVVGADKHEITEDVDINDSIACFRSGCLSHAFIDRLYTDCALVLYPSQYEGFGLPVINAMTHGKKIVVFNNQLNRELERTIPDAGRHLVFFDRFPDLAGIIERELADRSPLSADTPLRSWADAAQETEAFIGQILAEQPDRKRLENRWRTMNLIAWMQRERQNSVPDGRLFPEKTGDRSYLKKFMRKLSKSSKKRISKFLA